MHRGLLKGSIGDNGKENGNYREDRDYIKGLYREYEVYTGDVLG